jgi:hypothetical protein
MSLLSPRSVAEAQLYMELDPCRQCGAMWQIPAGSTVLVEGELASRYAGPCPDCGSGREFVFRLPDSERFPDEEEPSFGDGRSELVDAGEWLWVADMIGHSVPAEPAGVAPEQREQARFDLRAAAAAVSEAMKFIPAGAEMVPPEALWSERGLGVYRAEPGRFRRARLELARCTYREFAERFTAPAGPPR